ncbi:MAG: fluoride efflux transporter CrcB [Agarilytica sp.]
MQWLAVALGGSLGALSRYAIAISLDVTPGKFPTATFIINVLGSALMAFFFVIIAEKTILPIVWRQIIMVGFLGAFTTFSTFSMEALQLFHSGHAKLALMYMISTLVACVTVAALTYELTHKLH